jgi:hypothetical protein
MRGAGFAAVMVALSPLHALAQDYTNASNAAWCAGALGAYSLSRERGGTYLDQARSRQLAVAQNFFGSTGGAEALIFENRGGLAAAECNRACADEQEFAARKACFDASPDCKRIIGCLTNMPSSIGTNERANEKATKD